MAKTKNPPICKDKEQTAQAILQLGINQTKIKRLQAEIDKIATKAIDERQEQMSLLELENEALQASIQNFCEKNRHDLLKDGKKSYKFSTGVVKWTAVPDKVDIQIDEAELIENLKSNNLGCFVRVNETVNKSAILDNQDLIRSVKGVEIVKGGENFKILPAKITE